MRRLAKVRDGCGESSEQVGESSGGGYGVGHIKFGMEREAFGSEDDYAVVGGRRM